MKKLLGLAVLGLAIASSGGAQQNAGSDINGNWSGTLNVPGATLRLLIRISSSDQGLAGVLFSLDQSTQGIPIRTVTREGSTIKFDVSAVGGAFEATLNSALTEMDGVWTQAGGKVPLLLRRGATNEPTPTRRPQDPVKPYPYREEDVSYQNQRAQVRLAGTVTIPAGSGPFPAVLLITGSGPQDRDESIAGHRPFLVLADYLTRRDILVLRADDRGVGKSTRSALTATTRSAGMATTADLAADAESGLAFLKGRADVDERRVGMIGHSEGGTIAQMIAARDHGVAFIVMLAGPGVSGRDIIVEQVRRLAEASGMDQERVRQTAAKQHEILQLVMQETDRAVLAAKLKPLLGADVPDAQVEATLNGLTSPWYRFFLKYDPAASLRQVRARVLAINGDKDVQVSSRQNLPAIRRALESGGNQRFDIDERPGLNHLFQHAKTGLPDEYAQIEETIAPAVLEKIAAWITAPAAPR